MTTPVEDRLRADLPLIASSIESTPRPAWPTRATSPRRRRAALFGIGAVIVFGGGIAVAVRIIPDDVQYVNEHMNEYGGCGLVLEDEGRVVATTQRADGNNLELWIFPTSTGLVADHVRIVAPDGSPLGSAGGCGSEIDATYAWTSTEIASGQSTGIIDMQGHINEDAESVLVRFDSGATVVAAVQLDGYFLVSFRGDVHMYEAPATVEPWP